jgi:hypothetical protein
MEPYVTIKPEDLEVVKKYEKLEMNFKRLLSQIFTLVAIEYKILVGRAQAYNTFSGWHFRFKDYRCWFGVCFKSENFLGTRFQVQTEGTMTGFKEALLKIKGFEEVTWDKAVWLGREQPTKALEITDRDQQIKAFSEIANSQLAAIVAVEAQLSAGGSIPLKPI